MFVVHVVIPDRMGFKVNRVLRDLKADAARTVLRDLREYRVLRDKKVGPVHRASKDFRVLLEFKAYREHKDHKALREIKEFRDPKAQMAMRDNEEIRERLDLKMEIRVPRVSRVLKDNRGAWVRQV